MAFKTTYWVTDQEGEGDSVDFDNFRKAIEYVTTEQADILKKEGKVLGGKYIYKDGENYYSSFGWFEKGTRGFKYVEDYGEYTNRSDLSRLSGIKPTHIKIKQ